MYPFFESIAIIDGIPRNLDLHQERLEHTYQFHFKTSCPFNLHYVHHHEIHNIPTSGKFKWKFLYSQNQSTNLLDPYVTPHFKKFYLIHASLEYPFKYSDRSKLLNLKSGLLSCEEIIIIKDSYVTDTRFSNLIFFDGQYWLTPSAPLLLGTMRHKLLDNKLIVPARIHLEDLHSFSAFQCINALNDMKESPIYSISIIQNISSNSHG